MSRRVFIDKQSPKAYHALTETAEAVRAVAADAGLDRALVELINLRVSQVNGCAYCLNVHTRAALRAGETTQRLGVLAAWRDTELFTARSARHSPWRRRSPNPRTQQPRRVPTTQPAGPSPTTRSPQRSG